MSNIPITPGTGATSVATETIGGVDYQKIKVIGGQAGSTSVMGVNPDGSINVSVIGAISATLTGNTSVSGTVVTLSQGSVAVVIISGSIAGVPNQSVSGTVGASIIGQLPAGTAVIGAVAASISGLVNVSGSVAAFQAGTQVTSLVSTVPSSVIVGASIFGALPAGNAIIGAVAASISGTVTITPASVSGTVGASIIGNVNTTITSIATVGQVMGSVAALQATNPWNIAGSVAAFQTGTRNTSIIGAYAEDAGHTSGDVGLFALAVRNDTFASVTSADIDYSPISVGPVGEVMMANAPITKWVSGTASILATFGTSVAAIAAQGASIFTYITGVQIANFSGSSVLVTLSGGTSSIIGYAIAPASGGSNIVYPNPLKTNANSAFTASVTGVCSVYLTVEGFISKT